MAVMAALAATLGLVLYVSALEVDNFLKPKWTDQERLQFWCYCLVGSCLILVTVVLLKWWFTWKFIG